MKLITEVNWDVKSSEVIEEGTKKKSYYISSDYAIQTNKVNKNGRFYPFDIVEKEVGRYNKDLLQTGRAWGELGHPTNARINEKEIAHRFVEIKSNGDYFSVKAKILETPSGKIVQALIDDKEGQMGISTRAVGSIYTKENVQHVKEDLHFVTAGDIVTDPSAQKAFIKGICEGVDYNWIDGRLLEKIKKNVDIAHKPMTTIEEKQKSFITGFTTLLTEIALDDIQLRSFTMCFTSTLNEPDIRTQFEKIFVSTGKGISILKLEKFWPDSVTKSNKQSVQFIMTVVSKHHLQDSDKENILYIMKKHMEIDSVWAI